MSCLVQRETSLGSSRFSGWLLNLKKTTKPAVLVSYRSHTEVSTITPVCLLYDIFSSLTSAFVKIRTPLHDCPPSPNDESGEGGQSWSGDIKCCAGQGRKN